MSDPDKNTGQPTGATDRFVQIIKILIWPIALIAIMLIFKGTSVPKEIELNEKGIKISFYLLQAAERGGPSGQSPTIPPNAKDIQDTARKASAISLNSAKVLWVDDNPQNQEYERSALSALGIEFSMAKTTGEAVELLKGQKYNLVITDFKRIDDPRAGYTLLKEMRQIQSAPPLIIYSAAASPEFEAEAKQLGAYAETNQPQRLFSLAIEAMVNQERR